MTNCERCNKYVFGKDECRCQPIQYRIKGHHGEDEWSDGYCRYRDTEGFAEEVAERYFNEEPCDPRKFEVTIVIRDDRKCEVTYRVTAEATVDFNASEQESPAGPSKGKP